MSQTNINPNEILTNPIHFLAFGFGSGLSPIAPGTAGTLVAIPIYVLLYSLGTATYLLATLIICVAGIWICQKSSEALGVHDHGGIVWDEIAGYLITMAFIPINWKWMLIGFLLFRLFDIWKPYPIRLIDNKVGGGLGIMMDDWLAGIYAMISLHIIIYATGYF